MRKLSFATVYYIPFRGFMIQTNYNVLMLKCKDFK